MKPVLSWGPSRNQISHIWIIDRESGICVYEVSWNEDNIDSDLVSGFLLATYTFGQEIAGKDIRTIDFGDLQILFTVRRHFLVALTVPGKRTISARKLLQRVAKQFETDYGGTIESWTGRCAEFQGFDDVLARILGASPTPRKCPLYQLWSKLRSPGQKLLEPRQSSFPNPVATHYLH